MPLLLLSEPNILDIAVSNINKLVGQGCGQKKLAE